MVIIVFKQILIIVTLCIPLPSDQHFIWPVHMCLLADICNHTWIPECGKHMETLEMRLFLDECDLYEYSCDSEKNFVIQNYSDCFIQQPGALCPTIPCPSHPPCKNHRWHRAGDHYIYPSTARRMLQTTPLRPPHPLPAHMLHGKRRYTPKPKMFSTKAIIKNPAPKTTKNKCTKITETRPLGTTISLPKQKTKSKQKTKAKQKTKPKQNLVVLRKEVFMKNGKKAVRIFKGLPTKPMATDSDFLEK